MHVCHTHYICMARVFSGGNQMGFTKLIKISFQHGESVIDSAFKWHSNAKSEIAHEFSRKPYEAGDPVWIIKNGSISYIG